MNTYLFFLLSLVVAGFSSCSESASLSGTVTGVESDSLLVFSSHMNERRPYRTDTVALVNNQFQLQYPDSALFVSIVAKPRGANGAIRMPLGGPILYFPGDKLKVEGTIDSYKISGSELYDDLSEYKEIRSLQDEVNSLNCAFTKAYQERNEAEKSRIKLEVKACYERLQSAKYEAVKKAPNSMAAAYFATQLNPEEGLHAISLLTTEVKSGPMGKLIVSARESYQKRLAREEAKVHMRVGNIAPDFALSTSDGELVTLKSFRGKYLLIDFWGTWCGWCMKGIPEMKNIYNKYKSNIEFLGVNCGDTEAKWRKSVEANRLPWVNVMEGKSNLSVSYAVEGYPTKILIDPEGRILHVYVGESSSLYEKLDQLFGK